MRGDAGKKNNTPTVGNRVDILGTERDMDVDPALANVAVILPLPAVNDAWAQPGGNASKSPGHVELGQGHARRLGRGGGVQPGDAGVGVGRAQEDGVGLAVQRHVIGVLAGAGQEALVLAAAADGRLPSTRSTARASSSSSAIAAVAGQ